MDEKTIFTYLSGKIVEDIRNKRLRPDIALALSIYPMNDYIRPLLKEGDIPSLVNLLNDDNPIIRAFAAMISRPFQTDSRIRKSLNELWDKRRQKEFIVGFAAIYRLLEYQDETNVKKTDFFGFIKKDWEQWKKKLIASYPDPERILEGAQSRLNDPNFPSWKKWIYLIEIACSPNKNEAREFLGKFDPGTDHFVAEVKRWALAQL